MEVGPNRPRMVSDHIEEETMFTDCGHAEVGGQQRQQERWEGDGAGGLGGLRRAQPQPAVGRAFAAAALPGESAFMLLARHHQG